MIPLTNDIYFKSLLVRDRAALQDFLSAALGKTVESIKIRNPEILPEAIAGKFCRLDLNIIADGERINVEMQTTNEGHFPERSLFYWAKLFTESAHAGDAYEESPRTVMLNLLSFKLFDTPSFFSEFLLLENSRHELLTDRLSLRFYELPKIQADDPSRLAMWLRLFGAQDETDLSNLEKTGDGVIMGAIERYRTMTAEDNLREVIRVREKQRRDESNALYVARKKGRTEGRMEGRTETLRILAQKLDLSVEELQRIADEQS